jgi:hypothetical protein
LQAAKEPKQQKPPVEISDAIIPSDPRLLSSAFGDAHHRLGEMFHPESRKQDRLAVYETAVRAAVLIRAATTMPDFTDADVLRFADLAEEILRCNSAGDKDALFDAARLLGLQWARRPERPSR